MRLTSYQIDGRLPRTGAANFSASGPQATGQNEPLAMLTPSGVKR